ncbi:hypothetical protein AB0M50_48605 [Nonomuraea fuscirosea]|uniref:hypothetical protein n=1 Tax=Nonomuraea fuscirosea TaxID=1291556 RepID=UPI002DD8ECA2|nr:hypothetical protein [Nonomuraea fuscirosea]WSA55755.1 hypothetical protein OIE67_14455 [Nonomuraea fuscirosea]
MNATVVPAGHLTRTPPWQTSFVIVKSAGAREQGAAGVDDKISRLPSLAVERRMRIRHGGHGTRQV